MNKSTVPFIKTSDAGTKDELLKEGFQLISYTNGMWTFLNDLKKDPAVFKKDENLIYSNNLEF